MNLLPAFTRTRANVDSLLNQVFACDALALLAALPDNSIDLIATDPPYGNNNGVGDLASARARDKVKGGRQAGDIPVIANDDFDSWSELIPKVIQEFNRVLKPCGAYCMFVGGGGGERTHFADAIKWCEQYASFFHAVIWDKSARGYGLGWRYRRNYEMILVGYKSNGKLKWGFDRPAQPNIAYHKPDPTDIHPTPKPVDLMKWLIFNHTDMGDIVLDPFAGSGSTAIAAKQTGRNYILGDNGYDDRTGQAWADLARRRIQNSDAYQDTVLPDGSKQLSLFSQEGIAS